MSTANSLTQVRQGATERRERFSDWRSERPFWGGLLLAIAGLVIGIIPADLAVTFAMVPGTFAVVGLIFAILIFLCGVFALAKPELASFFGLAGILLSVASILGALGGFIVGTLLGAFAGSLCVAWKHPKDRQPSTQKDEISTASD